MRVSLAIPVYNEETVVPELLRRVRAVLAQISGGPHEIVIVDDGSTDRTPEILKKEAEESDDLVAILFSRNFGHQAALTAALDHVTGDVTIAMDGDLQDPPEAILQFLDKYAQGYDVVYARRVQRKEVWWLRACYFLFYRLIAKLSRIELPLDAGDFGLMSKQVVDRLRQMPEYHRYLRGMRTWIGYRQTGIPIERAQRHSGEPKYSTWKLLKLASDGIFSFSVVPLRLAAILGGAAIVFSALYTCYAIYIKLSLGYTPQGFTTLICAIAFLAGVQLFCMGIIGEYVGRLYEASKGRPSYIVSRQFGRVGNAYPHIRSHEWIKPRQ